MADDIEIRVGVLAARTFIISNGAFRPISYKAPTAWETHQAVAECHRSLPLSREPEPIPEHQSPDLACTCGLFSFRTVQEVARQYSKEARDVIAVIEPAGYAVAGSLGQRSQRATILAAWIWGLSARNQMAARYPAVKFYSDLPLLLRDYQAVDDGSGFIGYTRALQHTAPAA